MDSARTDGAVEEVLASLPSVHRLALAYGAGRLRLPMLGLMALDTRLGSIVCAAREPILGQLRLGWWRQTLARPTGEWPEGEPLLAVLRDWPAAAAPLSGLVDGWEELLGEPPLPPAVFNRLADARA